MYNNMFSVSKNKSAKHGNYTFGFELKNIVYFSDFASGGFTSLVFNGEHRAGENVIGLTNLGYVDIDNKKWPLFTDTLKDWCRERGMALARSASESAGSYRIIFKRNLEIVIDSDKGDCVVLGLGLGLEQYRTKSAAGDVASFVLKTELEWFAQELSALGASDNIDVTSANAGMHSKEIGEVLVDMNVFDLIEIPLMPVDWGGVKNTTRGEILVESATQNGLAGRFKVVMKGDKETIRLVSGNCFKALINGNVEDVGIADCVKRRCHLLDPLAGSGLNLDVRCEDSDAYMPFICAVSADRSALFVTSGGQHNRNFSDKSVLLIVFKRDTGGEWSKEFVSEISVDGSRYLIDEKNKKFRDVETGAVSESESGAVGG